MNLMILSGNLTTDPVDNSTEKGMVVTGYIAVSKEYKNADGNYESFFFPYVAMSTTAKYLLDYCKKGYKVCFTGSFSQNMYTDKEGKTRNDYKMFVKNVEVLHKREDKKNEEQPKSEYEALKKAHSQQSNDSVTDDDLPF